MTNLNINNGNDPKLDSWLGGEVVEGKDVKESSSVGVSTQSTISKDQSGAVLQQGFSTNASFPKLPTPDPDNNFNPDSLNSYLS